MFTRILSVPVSLVPLLFPFALIHGAKRYAWNGIVVFVVFTFIISNILENLSILTGVPFGHYYYTDSLGPKLALVPIFIALSYVSFGYLAWVLSTVVVSEVRRRSSVLTAVAIPLVASFIMVPWDISLDPIASTINPRLDLDTRRRILRRANLQLPRLVFHRVHLLPAFRDLPKAAWVG